MRYKGALQINSLNGTIFTGYQCYFLDETRNRGYYTVARRYEFYVRVARTISHECAQRTSEILFLPREH